MIKILDAPLSRLEALGGLFYHIRHPVCSLVKEFWL